MRSRSRHEDTSLRRVGAGARFGRVTGAPSWHRSARALGLAFSVAGALLVVGLLTWMTWAALTRTATTSSSRLHVFMVFVGVLLVWLGISALVSRTDRYRRSPLSGTALILIPVVAATAYITSAEGAPAIALLDATPASLIGLQAVRVAGGVFLVAWLSGGVQRPWFSAWAGSIDVFIGVTALPLACWVSTGSSAASAVGVAWNLLGLLDFAVAIIIVNVDRTVLRDLLHSYRPVALLIRPTILFIFSFAVPVMAILHLLSIRQLT